ncbi:MAG: hypothetical protein VX278_17905 [Myxococcota bacterium]|nr:hypothetical protein [Myxococcota bacterium]
MSILFFLSSLALAIPPRTSAKDQFRELSEEKFTLYFKNAVTGQPIAGAQIRFQGATKRTKSDGSVRFDFPDDLDSGEDFRSLQFSKSGFVSSEFELPFQVGTLWFNQYSVSPELPLKKLRIVLDWGAKPRDLDAHLVRDGSYHISYRNKKSVVDHAALDRDDTDGHGPETVTLHTIDSNSDYHYFVRDYSNRSRSGSSGLSKSGARIHVYTSNGRQETYYVPTNQTGRTWSVFKIRNGKIVPSMRLAD